MTNSPKKTTSCYVQANSSQVCKNHSGWSQSGRRVVAGWSQSGRRVAELNMSISTVHSPKYHCVVSDGNQWLFDRFDHSGE